MAKLPEDKSKTERKKQYREEKAFYARTSRLYKQAKDSPTAMNELVRWSNTLARKANKRLLSLERAGKDRWAYESAANWLHNTYQNDLKKNRFKMVSSKLTPKQIQLQMLAIQRFLNQESSTVAGQEAIMERQYEMFVSSHNISGPGTANPFASLPKQDVKDFLYILGSSSDMREFIKAGYKATIGSEAGTQYTSGNIVDILRGAYFELGYDSTFIQEIFARYQLLQNAPINETPKGGLGFTDMLEILKGTTTLEEVLASRR